MQLLDEGWNVRVATRGLRPLAPVLRERVAQVVIDRAVPGAIAAAVGGGADAVIDTIAYDDGDAEQLLSCRASVGAFAVISSASVYLDDEGRSLDRAQGRGWPAMPVPITEAQPTVAPGAETYATRKVAMERRLLDSGAAVAVIRPCAVHGPEARDPREWWFVKRLLDGRARIPLAYGGASRFHTAGVANIAAVVSAALAAGGARVLNAVDPDAPSVTEIGHVIMALLTRSAALVPMPDEPVGSVGGTPWSVPHPFVLSDAAARAIGYLPVADYGSGVAATIRWLAERVPPDGWQEVLTGLAKYPYDLFDYAGEDRWIAG